MKIFIQFLIMVSFLSASANPLKVGDPAPDFSLLDQDSTRRRLSDYRGQKVVVFFFVKADTPGWIKEACGFRDINKEYIKKGIAVLGISYDTPDKLRDFRDKFALPFPLLSDKTKNTSKNYESAGLFLPKRKTFILDENGFIKRIYNNVNVNTHAELILKDMEGIK